MGKEELIRDVITVANTAELVKRTIAKVGMEFIAPLGESVQDEKITKAVIKRAKGLKQ
jgi:hypothetical protein